METQLTLDGMNKRYYESGYLKVLRSAGFRPGWIQGLRLVSLSAPLLLVSILGGFPPLIPHEEAISSSRLILKPTSMMWTSRYLLLRSRVTRWKT